MTTSRVNGSIEIRDIRNNVDVSNVNGDVLLTHIVGGIAARVDNGGIECASAPPANQTMELSTTNGGVRLFIPTSTSADFSAEVVHGEMAETAGAPAPSEIVIAGSAMFTAAERSMAGYRFGFRGASRDGSKPLGLDPALDFSPRVGGVIFD